MKTGLVYVDGVEAWRAGDGTELEHLYGVQIV